MINSVQDIKKLFTIDIDSIMDDIFKMQKVQNEIIELNQIEQLSEGIDTKEQKIRTIASQEQGTKAYSRMAIAERSKRGLQVDKVDLKFSGDFWDTFRIKAVSEGWEVIANWMIHNDDIRYNFENRFDFLGLTPDNLDLLVHDTILPILTKKIRKHFGI